MLSHVLYSCIHHFTPYSSPILHQILLIVDCLPRCTSVKRSTELESSFEKPGEYNIRNLLALRGKDMHVSVSASAVFVKHKDRDFSATSLIYNSNTVCLLLPGAYVGINNDHFSLIAACPESIFSDPLITDWRFHRNCLQSLMWTPAMMS